MIWYVRSKESLLERGVRVRPDIGTKNMARRFRPFFEKRLPTFPNPSQVPPRGIFPPIVRRCHMYCMRFLIPRCHMASLRRRSPNMKNAFFVRAGEKIIVSYYYALLHKF